MQLAQQAAELAASLAKAKDEHIRDLRILVSNAQEAGERNEALMRLVLEHHFYRPTITRAGSVGKPETVAAPAIPLEALGGEPFDDEADAEQRKQEGESYQKAMKEFMAIGEEHEADRKTGFRGRRLSPQEIEQEAIAGQHDLLPA